LLLCLFRRSKRSVVYFTQRTKSHLAAIASVYCSTILLVHNQSHDNAVMNMLLVEVIICTNTTKQQTYLCTLLNV